MHNLFYFKCFIVFSEGRLSKHWLSVIVCNPFTGIRAYEQLGYRAFGTPGKMAAGIAITLQNIGGEEPAWLSDDGCFCKYADCLQNPCSRKHELCTITWLRVYIHPLETLVLHWLLFLDIQLVPLCMKYGDILRAKNRTPVGKQLGSQWSWHWQTFLPLTEQRVQYLAVSHQSCVDTL